MVNWALIKIFRAIKNYSLNKPKLKNDRLIANDWHILIKIRDFLKPFRKVIKITESDSATIDRIL